MTCVTCGKTNLRQDSTHTCHNPVIAALATGDLDAVRVAYEAQEARFFTRIRELTGAS